ncbi:hypothetical protein EVAR_13610_1 [Eumeta japonica]|uniref:Uncharacterized protein n=1 Tax=Eumeta variegata TaxID=151549 RepID=A0A4C1UUJ1_EUMVA|nr:hypothetical protein EVAR_13610_1 [Eumeta japonica]
MITKDDCVADIPDAHYNALHLPTISTTERCTKMLKARFSHSWKDRYCLLCTAQHSTSGKHLCPSIDTGTSRTRERGLQIQGPMVKDEEKRIDSEAKVEPLEDLRNIQENKEFLKDLVVRQSLIIRLWQKQLEGNS